MGKNFRETLKEQLQDPNFKAEWDALEPERQLMRTIIEEGNAQDSCSAGFPDIEE